MSTRLKRIVLAGSLLLVLAGLAHGAEQPPRFIVHETPRPVPSIAFRDGEGRDRALADFRGKVVLLNVWAIWCAPCRKEMPTLDRLQAACWSHARRKFFVLADVAAKALGRLPVLAPLALRAVERIDAIFAIEREINGLDAAGRLAARRERSAALVGDLETWMRAERARLSRHADVAKAMDYMLKRWPAFERFLHDGRVCLSNNAAERALRGIALGRKAWLFAGSDRGGERAAVMYTLIGTARLNDIDPQAWLADVLARINDHLARDLDALLPWHWTRGAGRLAA